MERREATISQDRLQYGDESFGLVYQGVEIGRYQRSEKARRLAKAMGANIINGRKVYRRKAR